MKNDIPAPILQKTLLSTASHEMIVTTHQMGGYRYLEDRHRNLEGLVELTLSRLVSR